MKDTKDNISIEELETLCGLYMECGLTRLQERELQYVLEHTALRSPLVDDVRRMMGFSDRLASAHAVAVAPVKARRASCWSRAMAVNIAASVALIIGVAVGIHYARPAGSHDGMVCEVYVNGRHIVDEEAALTKANADLARARSIMARAEANRHEQEQNMKEMGDRLSRSLAKISNISM